MTDPMELAGRLEAQADVAVDGIASSVLHELEERGMTNLPQIMQEMAITLTEAAACIREMVEWRPIETAPRDGTVLLLRMDHGHCIVGFWLNGYWDDGDFAAFDSEDVKFWLPLPPAPGAEA